MLWHYDNLTYTDINKDSTVLLTSKEKVFENSAPAILFSYYLLGFVRAVLRGIRCFLLPL